MEYAALSERDSHGLKAVLRRAVCSPGSFRGERHGRIVSVIKRLSAYRYGANMGGNAEDMLSSLLAGMKAFLLSAAPSEN